MEKIKFNPDTLTSDALSAGMALVEMSADSTGKVTYNPDTLDVMTARIMAKHLYGVPAIAGSEPGTLILHPVWDLDDMATPSTAGCRYGRYVPDRESPEWKPHYEVPYITPYHGMALRAIQSLKNIEDSPIGTPLFKIRSIRIFWWTNFNPDCMLGINVMFNVRLNMESGIKYILTVRDRSVHIHPVETANPYFSDTTLDLSEVNPTDEDILVCQILGVLNTYTGLTYEKVQEFFDQKMGK